MLHFDEQKDNQLDQIHLVDERGKDHLAEVKVWFFDHQENVGFDLYFKGGANVHHKIKNIHQLEDFILREKLSDS